MASAPRTLARARAREPVSLEPRASPLLPSSRLLVPLARPWPRALAPSAAAAAFPHPRCSYASASATAPPSPLPQTSDGHPRIAAAAPRPAVACRRPRPVGHPVPLPYFRVRLLQPPPPLAPRALPRLSGVAAASPPPAGLAPPASLVSPKASARISVAAGRPPAPVRVVSDRIRRPPHRICQSPTRMQPPSASSPSPEGRPAVRRRQNPAAMALLGDEQLLVPLALARVGPASPASPAACLTGLLPCLGLSPLW
nr:proline-rich receptor-like protein kinase PERK9 [Aegilops tauschii subsp. strangulata]